MEGRHPRMAESTNGMQHIDNPKAKTNRHHAPATVSSACIKVGKSVLRSIVRTARGAKYGSTTLSQIARYLMGSIHVYAHVALKKRQYDALLQI